MEYHPERDDPGIRIHRIREDGSQQWVPEDQGPEDTGYELDDRRVARPYAPVRSGSSRPFTSAGSGLASRLGGLTSAGPSLASNSLDRRTGRLNYWAWLDAGADRLGLGGTLLEDDTPDLYEREGIRNRPSALTAGGNPENARMPDESFFERDTQGGGAVRQLSQDGGGGAPSSGAGVGEGGASPAPDAGGSAGVAAPPAGIDPNSNPLFSPPTGNDGALGDFAKAIRALQGDLRKTPAPADRAYKPDSPSLNKQEWQGTPWADQITYFDRYDLSGKPRPQPAANLTVAGIPPMRPDLGESVKRFESTKGVAEVSIPVKNDAGGVSYGSYQFTSKDNKRIGGTVREFVYSPEGSDYRLHFAGSTPGSPEFSKRWRNAAGADPTGLHAAEKAFIYRTHYLPGAKKVSEAGLDMNNPGVQDAVLSGTIQHGSSKSGFPDIVESAVRSNPGFQSMSAEDQLKAIYWARSNKSKIWDAGGGRYFGRPQDKHGEFSAIRDLNSAYQNRRDRKT
ncbi:hypothetical protein NNJEOMEG_03865 [Fundidesulfovibrio magnetotacticus]|uniref:Type VI secretion system spike protein VgrG3-like C-terminal domain-containing protein n=1 Tax=Fundidesulfovibrio magnetotacticus TaxID=2730080 RepID=A0A6V8LZL6_9BACT|nr:hypothetical protein [Fundidesulfovibrio magnetotacticus]GFK95991.1 hypothetical protein NNJEOMEG_03865 [Fundidesulfovibrio magnetotacticus]